MDRIVFSYVYIYRALPEVSPNKLPNFAACFIHVIVFITLPKMAPGSWRPMVSRFTPVIWRMVEADLVIVHFAAAPPTAPPPARVASS